MKAVVLVLLLAICWACAGEVHGEVYLDHSGAWTAIGVWNPSAPVSGTDWAKIGQSYNGGDNAPTVSISPGDNVSGAQNLAVGRDLAGGITATINMSGGTLSGGNLYVGNNNNATGVVNQSGGLVTMSGNIEIGAGDCEGRYNLNNDGVLTVTNTIYVGNGGIGSLTLNNAGNLSSFGNLYVGQGSGSGNVTQNGGTNTMFGGEFQVSRGGGTGTYTMTGGVLNATAPTTYIGNGAVGAFAQSGGTANFGTVNLGYNTASTYTLSGDGLMNVVTFNKNTGGSTFNFNGGTLSADTVNFDLTSTSGTLAPGRADTTGKTQVNGTFTNGAGATVQIQIGGTTQGSATTGYDWLSANGAVMLNGTLSVALVNSFTPAGGDTFTVVSGSAVSGTFANAPVSGQRYNLGRVASFTVTYYASTVVLSDYRPATAAGTIVSIQ